MKYHNSFLLDIKGLRTLNFVRVANCGTWVLLTPVVLILLLLRGLAVLVNEEMALHKNTQS